MMKSTSPAELRFVDRVENDVRRDRDGPEDHRGSYPFGIVVSAAPECGRAHFAVPRAPKSEFNPHLVVLADWGVLVAARITFPASRPGIRIRCGKRSN